MLFDELGVRYKALDSLPDDVLRELRDGVVGVLTVADATHGGGLLLTLEAYLAGGYSVSETAAALFIHLFGDSVQVTSSLTLSGYFSTKSPMV